MVEVRLIVGSFRSRWDEYVGRDSRNKGFDSLTRAPTLHLARVFVKPSVAIKAWRVISNHIEISCCKLAERGGDWEGPSKEFPTFMNSGDLFVVQEAETSHGI